MTTAEPIASFTISVFARHSVDCLKHHDPQWKRCEAASLCTSAKAGGTNPCNPKRADVSEQLSSPLYRTAMRRLQWAEEII